LQCVTGCCSDVRAIRQEAVGAVLVHRRILVLQCVVVCGSVRECVAACCSGLR